MAMSIHRTLCVLILDQMSLQSYAAEVRNFKLSILSQLIFSYLLCYGVRLNVSTSLGSRSQAPETSSCQYFRVLYFLYLWDIEHWEASEALCEREGWRRNDCSTDLCTLIMTMAIENTFYNMTQLEV